MPTYGATFALSPMPSDAELARVPFFHENLAPLPGSSSGSETAALASALDEVQLLGGADGAAPLERFLQAYPASRWAPAILLNLGDDAYATGRFQRAMSSWQRAWNLAKVGADPVSRRLANLAIAEYARMNARVGRQDELDRIFQEVQGREFLGDARVKLHSALEGRWAMAHKPGIAFRCGPYALTKLAELLGNSSSAQTAGFLSRIQSPPTGFSLQEVLTMSSELGLRLQMAKRSAGAQVIVPAVIHWKVGHFGALAREVGGKFLLEDPTFGNETMLSASTIDDEASGYFLVPAGPLPVGWSSATPAEAALIYGKGHSGNSDPDETGPEDNHNPDPCGPGPDLAMATYKFHLLLTSLSVSDTPVGYSPAVGEDVRVRVVYNQREADQPTSMQFTNFSPQWVSNWISYIEDNPSSPNANVKLRERGGGGETHSGFNPGTQSYTRQTQSNSVLYKLTANTYKKVYADGSEEYYEQYIGTTGPSRRVFLSRVRDPQGNQVALEYDSSYPSRIHRIIDAAGLPTDFSYTYSGEPYLVTEIEDPYARRATFNYTSVSGTLRLQSIEDVAGIVSSFAYNSAGEMTSLATPYGTTTFTLSPFKIGGGFDMIRFIEARDPQGDRHRAEYNTSAAQTGVVALESPRPDSTIVKYYNSDNDDRNTFYWDKMMMRYAAGDYLKAHLYHWVQTTSADSTSSILEREKPPLEGHIYYNYPGQTQTYIQGTSAFPSVVGRALQDYQGTTQTQATNYEYNTLGNITKVTDPAGRETVTEYAANGVDVTAIKQRTGASTYSTIVSYTYDGSYPPHRPKTMTDAAGRTTTYTYVGASGQLATMTNAKNEVVTLSYGTNTSSSSYRRLISVTGDVLGGNRYLSYDSGGRVRTLRDSEGYVLTYDYDALDRVRVVTYPDGSHEQFEYADHSLTASRDRQGRWTRNAYNALLQRVLTRDPAGVSTQTQWAQCGAIRRLVDGALNRTEWTHDVEGRATRKTYADGSHEDYGYDFSGRLLTETDPMSRTKTHQYGVDDRLLKLDYSDSATPDVTFTYDSYFPRVSTRVDGVGTTTYVYNPLDGTTLGAGQVARINGPFTDDTLKHTYDELGRMKKLEIVDDATFSTASYSEDHTFDARGRVSQVVNSLGTFNYSYVGQSTRTSTVDYPNGMRVTYGYYGPTGDELLKQIKNLTAGPTRSVISQFDYTYGADRSIATWAQAQGGAAATTWTFGYDPSLQLTTAVRRDSSNNILDNQRFGYDPARNRDQVVTGTVVRDYKVNKLNQLLAERGFGATTVAGTTDEAATVTVNGQPAKVTSTDGGAPFRFEATAKLAQGNNTVTVQAVDGRGNTRTNNYLVTATGTTATFEYDADGNLRFERSPAGAVTREYRWDAQDRLVRVIQGSHESVFEYDGESRRTRIRELVSGAETKNEVFIWCGSNICQKRASNGTTVSRSHFDRGFKAGTPTYFYTRDHLGSIWEVVGSNGSTIESRVRYSPWGEMTNVSGSGAKADFAFTGHYSDVPNNLALAQYRGYAASRGRWLSLDPAGFVDGANLYRYVRNSPPNFFDPNGLLPSQGGVPGLAGGGATVGPVSPLVLAILAFASAVAVMPPPQPISLKPTSATKPPSPVSSASPAPSPGPAPSAPQPSPGTGSGTPPNKRTPECEKIYDGCIVDCTACLPTGTKNGAPFYRCVNKCMYDAGCQSWY